MEFKVSIHMHSMPSTKCTFYNGGRHITYKWVTNMSDLCYTQVCVFNRLSKPMIYLETLKTQWIHITPLMTLWVSHGTLHTHLNEIDNVWWLSSIIKLEIVVNLDTSSPWLAIQHETTTSKADLSFFNFEPSKFNFTKLWEGGDN